jgi:hypothetical protein
MIDELRYWVTSLDLIDDSSLIDASAAQALADDIAMELNQ